MGLQVAKSHLQYLRVKKGSEEKKASVIKGQTRKLFLKVA